METDEVVELYDSVWFELLIFKEIPNISNPSANPEPQIQPEPSDSETSPIPSVDSMSMSDSIELDSFSPDSVLLVPSHHTYSSVDDVAEDFDLIYNHLEVEVLRGRKKLRKRRKHKSLSELEFEELKGFMDLGFVFSEEDRDSSLASIIPGLQRLGNKEGVVDSAIPRPYLSETWEVMVRKKKENPLMNWKIHVSSSEVTMKDNLRWWAHAVASTVR